MSELQLKAYICSYIHSGKVRYFWELRKHFIKAGRWDLLLILDEDSDFSEKVKLYLFRERIKASDNSALRL